MSPNCNKYGKTVIAHVTTAHPAMDIRIFWKECRSLAKADYNVYLLAPNERDQYIEGVNILALGKSKNRLDRLVRIGLQAINKAWRIKAGAYHFHDPELFWMAVILRLMGKKIIFDLHEDLESQNVSKDYLPKWLRPFVSIISKVIVKIIAISSSAVITATPAISRVIEPRPSVVVRNFFLPDEDPLKGDPKERDLGVLHVGAISRARGAVEMTKAMEYLADSHNARLLLAGPMDSDELHSELKSIPAWRQVDYMGVISRQGVQEYLARSKIGLVTLRPKANYIESLPIKIFEFMWGGLPIVASDFPYWRELFGDIGCCIFVNPLDPKEIAQAVSWLLDNPLEAEIMGKKGREAAKNRFSWSSEEKKLLDVYNKILTAPY